MSKYTTTIKTLLDNKFDLGLKDYPIFDENYRNNLNQKIINHYFINEIGFETAGLFKNRLNSKMNEIMSYYNILYEKQIKVLEKFMSNVDIIETMDKDNTITGNSNSNSNSGSRGLFQDTPQGKIDFSSIEAQNWATNFNISDSDVSDTSSSNGNSTEDYIKKITGNNGTNYPIDLLLKLKNNIMNIDLFIINDLEELFMMIY